MKKVLFVTRESPESQSVGLWQKNLNQMNLFKENGFEVTYFNLSYSKNKYINAFKKNAPALSFHRWSELLSIKSDYDVIYIRYPMGDGQMISVLKSIKDSKPNVKIIIEIPTYPYIDELTNRRMSYFLEKKDNKATSQLKRYVDRIVTFSDDDFIWQIPTIKVSNIVDFSNMKPKKAGYSDDNINLIAVATFSKWHGYDRVIDGLVNYYNDIQSRKIKLHLVGTGKELNSYKMQVKNYNLENYIKFHGQKQGMKLDAVYDLADIALDSMGRHRSGVYYNSTLKGKEYGAKGLPIISGVKTELDYYPNYKYYLKIPSDDSPVDMNKVIEFYNEIYSSSTEIEVIESIRLFNMKNFNPVKIWSEVMSYMS